AGCTQSPPDTAPAGGPTSSGKPGAPATIKASPNPVPAGATKFGTTTLTWDTGAGNPGEGYVSPNGAPGQWFGGPRAKGSQEAPWIAKGEYEFRLYAGKEHKTVLATVKVTRNAK